MEEVETGGGRAVVAASPVKKGMSDKMHGS
jgi:hypothetical protein